MSNDRDWHGPLHDVIQDAATSGGLGAVVRWVIVADVFEDGEQRGLHVLEGNGVPGTAVPYWETLGMLKVAEDVIRYGEADHDE